MKPIISVKQLTRILLFPMLAGASLSLNAATPAPAGLQFSATNFTTSEAARVVRVTVSRTGALSGSVSGNVTTSDGSASAGADYAGTNFPVVLGPGVAAASFPITLISDSINEPAEKFNVTLTGTNIGARAAATVTILDNDPAGMVSLSARAYSRSETGLVATVEIRRTAGAASGVSVKLLTEGGTATPGPDYSPVNTDVAFGPGEMRKIIEIPVHNDASAEGNETVNILLRDPAGGARLGAISNAVLTIVDDETAISFSKAGYAASESSGMVPVTVLRSGPLTKVVSVDVTTSTGNAIEGTDYKPITNRITFAAGVAAKIVNVSVLNDTFDDGDRTVWLNLSNPSTNAQLGFLSSTMVTIADNDAGGNIAFSATNYTVVESARKAIITLRRTGGTASGVSVFFMAIGGSALSGTDYTPVFTTVYFNAGEVAKTVEVPIMVDTLLEPTETVVMQILNARGGATIGASNVAILNIQNTPDPNAVPLAGASFFKATINGKAFNASGAFFTTVFADYGALGGPTLANFIANGFSGFSNLRIFNINAIPLDGVGVIHLDNSGNNGLAGYIETSGAGGRAWALADGSSSQGSEGTFTIDGLDIPNKRLSGRFNFKMRETTEGGGTGFITAVGSFRTVMR